MEGNILSLESAQHMHTDGTKSRNIAIDAFSKVISENWQKKIKDDKLVTELLQEHASNMRNMLGSFDYEINTIHNIIASIKQMNKKDAVRYMKTIEALAYGYRTRLGAELASALIAGITLKARDLSSIQKFSHLLIDEIDMQIRYDEARIRRRERKIEQMTLTLRYNESSFLSFLKRKKITKIKRRISLERDRINRIEERKKKNEKFETKIKEMLGLLSTQEGTGALPL